MMKVEEKKKEEKEKEIEGGDKVMMKDRRVGGGLNEGQT